MQPAQLRPGVDAELLDQDRPGPLVGQQRIGLPTRAVQGQQQLGPQPLPQRLLADQPFQLGHQLPVAAQPQVGLDPILQRDQPQLGQAVALGRADVSVQELLERPTAPQPQRLTQQRPCVFGRPFGERAARLGGQLLEPRRVQRSGRHPQQVARLAGDQHLAGGATGPARLQRPPQPLDVRLQGLGGGWRRLLPPQPPDERLHRHDLVGSCQQQGQQQTFLLPPQHHRAVVSLDLQRPEHPEPHTGSVVHQATRRKGVEHSQPASPATELPPGHHVPPPVRPTLLTQRPLPPAQHRPQERGRNGTRAIGPGPTRLAADSARLLVWSGLTLLAALAIALARLIATLALEFGTDPAPSPSPPIQFSPPGGHATAQ